MKKIADCPSSSSESDEEGEYEVEKILADEMRKDGKYYLVKWVGYRKKESTWESEDSFKNAKKILEEYKKRPKRLGNREMLKILDDEMREDGKYYLVKWKRCDDSMNRWKSEAEFKDDQRLVKYYEKKKKRLYGIQKMDRESGVKRKRLRQKTVNYHDFF